MGPNDDDEGNEWDEPCNQRVTRFRDFVLVEFAIVWSLYLILVSLLLFRRLDVQAPAFFLQRPDVGRRRVFGDRGREAGDLTHLE